MGFDIHDKLTGNSAEIVGRKLQVNLPRTSDAGYVTMFTESDPGEILGTPTIKSPETSRDYRLRTGIDTLKWSDTFNYAAQDTNRYRYYTSTLTSTWGSGYMILNGANNTVAGSTSGTSYKTFTLFGTSPLSIEYNLVFTAAPPANFIADVGIAIAATTAPYAPTDGVYVRVTSTSVALVWSCNSVESTAAVTTYTIVPGSNVKFVLVIDERTTELWIDDVLYASVDTPNGQGQPMQTSAVPLWWRLVNTGTASPACQVKISDVTVTQMDIQTSQLWQDTLCGMGLNAILTPPGQTPGANSNVTNASALPTAAALTASGATGAAVGLSGTTLWLPTLTAVAHGVVAYYANPASSAAYTGRTLYIRGGWIDSYVSTVLAGGPVNLEWSLTFGHTALTLATGQAAATKKPTFVNLAYDLYAANAAALSKNQRIQFSFANPIVVNAGEYVALVCRNLGTITTTGAITTLWYIDGSFE